MINPSQPKHHVLLCHEIGKDGQTCDRVICVDLATPDNLTANGLYLGTDALYVNMGNRFLYKVKIIDCLHENTMDVLEVIQLDLVDYFAYPIADNLGYSGIGQVCELENQSDSWLHVGNAPDLLCIISKDCTIHIYDRTTGDRLKSHDKLPA